LSNHERINTARAVQPWPGAHTSILVCNNLAHALTELVHIFPDFFHPFDGFFQAGLNIAAHLLDVLSCAFEAKVRRHLDMEMNEHSQGQTFDGTPHAKECACLDEILSK
jgi:hypothetical protein